MVRFEDDYDELARLLEVEEREWDRMVAYDRQREKWELEARGAFDAGLSVEAREWAA